MTAEKTKPVKVTVVGIGNSGVKIINRLAGLKESGWLNMIAVDTDAESIEKCAIPDKIVADMQWRNGIGCGGDVIKGQRSLGRERPRITELLEDTTLLIVTGGLGGGTATGGAPIFASVAKSRKIPTIFIMTTPFTLEGHSKRRIAEDGVRELLPTVDVLLCLPNDLLFSSLPADFPVGDAFEKADIEVARAILGVSEIMRCKNLLAADFSDFVAIMNKRKSVCSIGVGTAASSDGLNRCHLALERMLESPLLGGAAQMKEADALFLVMTGGPDLNIGETKMAFEIAVKFIGEDSKVIVGTNTDPAYADFVQITAITVKFDKKETKEDLRRNKDFGFDPQSSPVRTTVNHTPMPKDFEQGELPLQNVSKGIFLNTTPVNHNGEDLDVPTYQRRMIIIDKGE